MFVTVFGVLAVLLNLCLFSLGLFYGLRWVRIGDRVWAYGFSLVFFVLVLVSFSVYQTRACSWVAVEYCTVFKQAGVLVLAASTCNFAIVEAFIAAMDYWENVADS
jgi:hypothetical protein